jgi:hypothetical protein
MARRFPREFRVRAIELVRISDWPLSQVARELGVSNSALSRWVAEDDFAKAEAEPPGRCRCWMRMSRPSWPGCGVRCAGWRRRTRF